MTSVLNVDTIAAKDGTSPVALTKQSPAKAWIKVVQDTTHSISKSFNVSSIVDGGAGHTDAVFTSSMDDAEYACGQAAYISNNRRSIVEAATASQVTIQTYQVASNSSAIDATSGTSMIVMGDLA